MSAFIGEKTAALFRLFGLQWQRKQWLRAVLGVAFAILAQPVLSQAIDSSVSPPSLGTAVLPGVGIYSGAVGGGQAGGSGTGLVIQPRLTVTGIYTNNVNFASQNSRSDFITEVAPGISIVSNGARVRGFFDYSLRSLTYASDLSSTSIQRALNARVTVEAVSNWLFVDLSGTISRQTISAFGLQTSDLTRNNPNVTEVSTYQISPYVRGRLPGIVNYQVRYAETFSSSKASELVSDVRTTEWSGRFSDDYGNQKIGWSLQAISRRTDFKLGRTTENTQLLGTISYTVVPQLRFFSSAGQESNNYLTPEQSTYSVYGYGLRWRPTERTQIDAERFHRFFGEGHRIVFNHRMQRLAWQFSDIKDVTVNRNLGDVTGGAATTLFDVLFNQFASIEPDPIKRAQLVNNFLQVNGLNANAFASAGFLSSSVILQRRQQLSVSILGLRDYVTLLANQTQSQRLNDFASFINDFAVTSRIRQQGYGLQYSHTLAPGSSISLLAYLQKTSATESLAPSTLRVYSVNHNNRIGLKTTLTVGARHSIFDGGVNSYNEVAVYGQISVRF